MKDKVVIPEIKKTHKILLAIGLVCIIVGILLQIFLINKKIDFAVVRSIVITFLGGTILIFMGVIFFFFTLDIIKTSFISLVTHLLPLFLIISGAVLFGAFFYVQSGRQHINPELIEDDED